MNSISSNENELSRDDLDDLMSEIGTRIANDVIGKRLEDDDVDDMLVAALGKAEEYQLAEVVDNMIDLLSIAEIVKTALSDGKGLDREETEELAEYLEELDGDNKAVIKDLLN